MTITRIVHPCVNSITFISFLESNVEAGLRRNQRQFWSKVDDEKSTFVARTIFCQKSLIPWSPLILYAKQNESKSLNSTVQLNPPVSNHITGVALATTRSTNAAQPILPGVDLFACSIEVSCLKQGSKMKYFCLKQGEGLANPAHTPLPKALFCAPSTPL